MRGSRAAAPLLVALAVCVGCAAEDGGCPLPQVQCPRRGVHGFGPPPARGSWTSATKVVNTTDRLELQGLVLGPSWDVPNLPQLRLLRLKRCRVHSLLNTTLAGAPGLRLVDLEHNLLRTVAPGAFRPVSRLEHLSLRRNQLSVLPQDVFEANGNLVSLVLDSNRLETLPASLTAASRSLRYLYLKDNMIRHLSASVFSKLTNLRLLDVRGNPLLQFSSNSFVMMLQLKHLSLSVYDFGLLRLLRDLVSLSIEGSGVKQFGYQAFDEFTQLNKLSLSNNELFSVETRTFNHLTKLQVLDLSSNKIENITRSPFYMLSNLYSLNLANNSVMRLFSSSFKGLGNLRELNVSRNRINWISANAFEALGKLSVLDLSYNRLESLAAEALAPLRRLRLLSLRGNLLATPALVSALPPLPALQQLDASLNALAELRADQWRSLAVRLPALCRLDVAGNALHRLQPAVAQCLRHWAAAAELRLGPRCICGAQPPPWLADIGLTCPSDPECLMDPQIARMAILVVTCVVAAVLLVANAVLGTALCLSHCRRRQQVKLRRRRGRQRQLEAAQRRVSSWWALEEGRPTGLTDALRQFQPPDQEPDVSAPTSPIVFRRPDTAESPALRSGSWSWFYSQPHSVRGTPTSPPASHRT
ncbi:insulin-like growth factor-binding protein complex acid labile subunit [Schistocerca gregaria]|uniref:insulin-like growth factor-binding protein complex acid labile subunit n=1 Tax=Schistocerca gregaria TaxID=7010 RepID=UPI00211EFE13|nr:insulin-like growth factor-binding protein complex acid labile subunit [Schistocerca gregaria]